MERALVLNKRSKSDFNPVYSHHGVEIETDGQAFGSTHATHIFRRENLVVGKHRQAEAVSSQN